MARRDISSQLNCRERHVLRKYGFYNTQGSVYLTERNDMANLYRAIEALKKTDWFRDSVRDIRAFKVEDWSDFSPVLKEQ